MMAYSTLTKEQLQEQYSLTLQEYEACKGKGLKLDMSRGKPGREQLALCREMFGILSGEDDCIDQGVDVRNYGALDGIASCKHLFAEVLGVQDNQVFVGGNASLSLMYDTIAKAYTHGLLNSKQPWAKLDKVKFLCPAPGYDRHFAVSESFGMELITVPMLPTGPDMDVVEEYIKDPAVKGIWCVPKYSNPDGIIYSDETVDRLASMKPAAEDFIIMWDNAYCVHEFNGDFVPFRDILTLCAEAGNPNMVIEFASTSKITLPGAGVAVMAASVDMINYMKKLMSIQIISYDKVNQLRHVRFLKNKEGILNLMKQHATITGPKFEAVLRYMEEHLEPLQIASWSKPKGGYFISVNTMPGCAKRTVGLLKEAGVILTGAGATFPYGKDPEDKNIRLAPTMPPVSELLLAIEAFVICLKLATLEKLLEQ